MNERLSKHRWILRSLFFLFVVVAVLIIERLQIASSHSNHISEVNAAKLELQIVSARFEALINNEILRTTSLSNYLVISEHPLLHDHLQAIGREIVRQSDITKTVAVAPDDVVAMVYPEVGNEKVMGLRFRDIEDQWPSVLSARINQAPVLNGPVNLVEGGRGLLLRIPVYKDPPNNVQYWGNISLVVDWIGLLENSGIIALTNDYQITMFSDEYTATQEEPVYGVGTQPVLASQTINFPLNQWVIKSAPVPQLTTWGAWTDQAQVRLVAYPILLVLCIAFWFIYKLYLTANLHSLQDELTQLPNRRYLMYTLNQLAEHSDKTQSVFTILNIDLNRFKQINDTFGHGAGDTVLVEAANRLKSSLRGTDVVARVGGDEFIVLLPRVGNTTEIQVIVNNLKQRIEHEPVEVLASDKRRHRVALSCSIGFAVYEHSHQDLDQLLKHADEKMYQQKQSGALIEANAEPPPSLHIHSK